MSFQRVCFLTLVTGAFALCNLTFASSALASAKGDLKKEAREQASQMRASGAPESRCTFDTHIVAGHILRSTGQLIQGDRLVYINNINVSGMSDDDIIATLKGLEPDAKIPVRVQRGETQTDFEVECKNAADSQTIILKALDLAGRKKVEDCVSALAPIASKNMAASLLRFKCASASKKSSSYDLSGFAADVLENSIVAAHYRPDRREEVARSLRASMGILERTQYEYLVAQTEKWPGDETLFADSEPDWGQFRANAKSAILSGFFDPLAAIVEWPYGFKYGSWKPFLRRRVEGYWTCGRVNGKNRMGGYVGSRYFVVVLDPNARVLFNEVGDGGTYDVLSGACQQSVAQLPSGDSQATITQAAPGQVAIPTLADQLAKLAELKASGALTEEEYQAAKAKVLKPD